MAWHICELFITLPLIINIVGSFGSFGSVEHQRKWFQKVVLTVFVHGENHWGVKQNYRPILFWLYDTLCQKVFKVNCPFKSLFGLALMIFDVEKLHIINNPA